MYDGGVSATHPDTDTSIDVGAGRVEGLDPEQLGAYFVLTEAVSLLQHQIEQQLRAEGDLSYVQFQLLARLNARGPLTMTDLADGVVYSRSGLTYQAGLLERPASSPAAPPLTTNAPPWSPSPTTAGPSSAGSCPATSRSPGCCSTP